VNTGGSDAGVSPSAGCGKTVAAGNQPLTIEVAGTTRQYLLAIPTNYSASTPQPVYFAYHGHTQDYTFTETLGFQSYGIGVFPDGIVGSNGSGWDTSLTGVDVQMFDALVTSVEATTCVDQNRIYAAGFSFGASMANTLGCARGNVLRAFASVEGGILFGGSSSECKRPIPGWINQYQQDPTVSYATGLKAAQFFEGLDSSVNPVAYDSPNPCVEYSGTQPFVWCTPQGAVHQWPDYATAAIVRFFGTL
jgi:polyhydroxybutyrate depolymerase